MAKKKETKLHENVQFMLECATAAQELKDTLNGSQYMVIILDRYPEMEKDKRKIHEFFCSRRPDEEILKKIKALTAERKNRK